MGYQENGSNSGNREKIHTIKDADMSAMDVEGQEQRRETVLYQHPGCKDKCLNRNYWNTLKCPYDTDGGCSD